MRTLAFFLAALLAAPGSYAAVPAMDRSHGFFFNKPGATAQEAATDVLTCRAIADDAESQINAISVLRGGVGAILGGAAAGSNLKRANVENCMVIKGWRVYAMTRTEGAAWRALSAAARETELETLSGAEIPARGALLRQWQNDYAEPVLWQKP